MKKTYKEQAFAKKQMGKHKDTLQEIALRWIMPTEQLSSGSFADQYFINLLQRGYVFNTDYDSTFNGELKKFKRKGGDEFLNAFLSMTLDGGIDLMGEGRVRGIESKNSIMIMDGIGAGNYILTKCIELDRTDNESSKSMMLLSGQVSILEGFNKGSCTFAVRPLYDLNVADGRRIFFDLPKRLKDSFLVKELMVSAETYIKQATYLTDKSLSNVR